MQTVFNYMNAPYVPVVSTFGALLLTARNIVFAQPLPILPGRYPYTPTLPGILEKTRTPPISVIK